MAVEIVAKLLQKFPVQSGTSARGGWSKQEFLVETEDTYPKKICMNVWGDEKVRELSSLNDGETYRFSLNIESREYNQRWYTDIRAWKIDKIDVSKSTDPASVAPAYYEEPISNLGSEDDDLPF